MLKNTYTKAEWKEAVQDIYSRLKLKDGKSLFRVNIEGQNWLVDVNISRTQFLKMYKEII
jgi:hypothetical protein